MKNNPKQTIEHSIIEFVFKLYDKKIIKSDGVANRRLIKDRYYLDLKRKPFMDSMKFKRFLDIIKKYDLILDEKIEGKLEFKIDNIIKTKTDILEAKPAKTDKTKQKKDDSDVILSSTDSIELAYVTSFRRHLKRFTPTSKCCPICKLKFSTETESVVHFNDHGKLFLIRNLEMTFKIDMMLGIGMEIDRNASKLNFKLENKFAQILNVVEIYLYPTSVGLVPVLNGNAKVLKPSETFVFSVNAAIFNIPNHKYSLLIASENVAYEFVEQYHVTLKKTVKARVITDVSIKSGTPLKSRKLHDYSVTNCISDLYKNGFRKDGVYSEEEKLLLEQINKYITDPIETRLSKDNYVSVLNIMNQIEDYDLINTYKRYTVPEARLKACHTKKFYILETSQFEVEPTRLQPEVEVIITVEALKGPDLMISGLVDCMIKNDIVIWTEEPVPVNRNVKVEFILNRFTFKLQYQALLLVKQQKISHLFFPDLPQSEPLKLIEFKWFNRDIESNQEQSIAIKNIVNDTSFPAPYILFGPPGTGKTSTLVEAICQIYKMKPKAHILVTAETNFACNELATRLLKYLPQENIFRFFSRKSEKLMKDLSVDLLSCSNLDVGGFRIPYYDEIYGSRIVICTLATSGRLVLAGIKSDFFDYIFIDECGSAKEVASLIPIAGLGASDEELNAKLILAGDPKQLGPIILAPMATKMGQNCSMLERLMNYKIYQKDPDTNQYNNHLITKLLENYRSHSAILQFSNESFYDGELKAMAKSGITDWALNWAKLPNKKFPIIFHCATGKMRREKFSCSLYNKDELKIVRSYLETIFTEGIRGVRVDQSDVGVISPYAKQVRSIKDMVINKGWKNVDIGSTEQFQGREKKIIIISTVRSESETVGFLNNEKRLNVALTRAKSLLIVIGNAKTLLKDRNWKNFIEYCVNNGAIRGISFNVPKEEPEIDDLKDGIKGISFD